MSNTALSVADLTDYLQSLLEDNHHLQQLWVIGEVSSRKDHSSGLFFTLSDSESDAAIQCVAWNSLRAKLIQLPQIGEQVLVLGSIRLYPRRGEYRLVVFQCLAAGEGLQALHYQQLRSRLQAEGLFDIARKRPLPPHPKIVAAVTSPTAAAWGDIQRSLSQRYPGLHVLFSAATVQGEQAPLSIAEAIARVNADGRAEVLILARGGGAVEDLSCFNDERVVRAIADSRIPVIAGIGHQQDESLADLVADASAHTPTAAAEMAVPALAQLVSQHQQRTGILIHALQRRLEKENQRLQQLQGHLQHFPQTSRQLLQAEAHCQLLQQKLVALDPQAVLERGYAVLRQESGAVVRSAADVAIGQALAVQLSQGCLKVKIEEILP
jgi:exodeoxyribonuclease VII large subunit